MVSQGIAKSQEVNHASYPSPLPSYHAPLPSYPAPLPSLPSASYSRRTASPVGRQGWRGEQEQELADGTLVVMHQGQPRVVYGGAGRGEGAGQERPCFWRHETSVGEEEEMRRGRKGRRRMRRGGKRGQAAAKQEGVQKLKVLHSNICGFDF